MNGDFESNGESLAGDGRCTMRGWTAGANREWAGPQPGAVDGDFEEWDCGGGVAAGGTSGSTNSGERWERGGRSDRDERDDGSG